MTLTITDNQYGRLS